MNIRPLLPKDAATVAIIASQSFPEKWSESDFHYFLTHDHRVALGVENSSGNIVAYFVGLLVQGDLDIISIATGVEERRKGISKRLLLAVLTDTAVERAFLEVRVSNTAAQHLYEGMGFKQMGTRKKYYGGIEDALQYRWAREEN